MVMEMELYYQNETLYIDITKDLDELGYKRLKNKIFRIIEDYGVDRIVIQNHREVFHNKHFLRQMKQDFYEKYPGDFLIK